ncbi:hypothetical protein ASE12_15435 [Aeromicrobium sp. Root236]|uniref:hypothetical protein n=1 Tax=Aeromicrobium sp. Root236 TaxID=1736498 RepID=UPI0006FF7C43|nr:hypothetical protein [Aeromicrobium sp. Root236]KRC66025.1 hypothetical protein ASE12_15435 [Aeromicrobium sp. Root236]
MFQQFLADWSHADELDLLPANAFVGQLGAPSSNVGLPDCIYIVIGHVAPPLIVGDNPADIQRQVNKLHGKLPVKGLARLVLTRERAAELRDLMANMVAQFDAAHRQGVTHG